MQAGIITTNLKVNIDFTLPELSATKIVTWKHHIDDSAKGRYDYVLHWYHTYLLYPGMDRM